MYRDAPSWGEEWLQKKADGSPYKGGVWLLHKEHLSALPAAQARLPRFPEPVFKVSAAHTCGLLEQARDARARILVEYKLWQQRPQVSLPVGAHLLQGPL